MAGLPRHVRDSTAQTVHVKIQVGSPGRRNVVVSLAYSLVGHDGGAAGNLVGRGEAEVGGCAGSTGSVPGVIHVEHMSHLMGEEGGPLHGIVVIAAAPATSLEVAGRPDRYVLANGTDVGHPATRQFCRTLVLVVQDVPQVVIIDIEVGVDYFRRLVHAVEARKKRIGRRTGVDDWCQQGEDHGEFPLIYRLDTVDGSHHPCTGRGNGSAIGIVEFPGGHDCNGVIPLVGAVGEGDFRGRDRILDGIQGLVPVAIDGLIRQFAERDDVRVRVDQVHRPYSQQGGRKENEHLESMWRQGYPSVYGRINGGNGVVCFEQGVGSGKVRRHDGRLLDQEGVATPSRQGHFISKRTVLCRQRPLQRRALKSSHQRCDVQVQGVLLHNGARLCKLRNGLEGRQ